jgi:nitrate reductase NapE component
MVKNNYLELGKTIIKAWVDKALQQSLKKENIKSRFRVFIIWPLNHVAMVGKFGPGDVFIVAKKEEHELSYHSNAIDESSNNEANVTIKLLNIVKTF